MEKNETSIVEVIENRLYWISDRYPPATKGNIYYFCIDSQLVYRPYAHDFGPLDIGKIYSYCCELNSILHNNQLLSKKIYHYSSLQPGKRANSALLIGAFQIIMLQRTADEVCDKFQHISKFRPFVDASQTPSSFEIYIGDCMKAIEKAVLFQWFSLSTFNLREYEAAATLEHGGFNWIVPGKVLAFVCPSNEIILQGPITPERYVQIFLKLGVTCIVRLNNKTYDSSRFTRHGIKHKELYFIDGSVPSENIVRGFVETLEEENVVAVHCKAGLGRTGTLIGCYAMKHFAITAEEFISWCRICRPGSILGPQQQFLCDVQEWCKKWAAGQEGDFGQSVKSNNMQGEEGFKARFGDYGQASRLQLKSNSPKARNSQRPRLGLSPRIKNYQLGKAESQALFNGKMYK